MLQKTSCPVNGLSRLFPIDALAVQESIAGLANLVSEFSHAGVQVSSLSCKPNQISEFGRGLQFCFQRFFQAGPAQSNRCAVEAIQPAPGTLKQLGDNARRRNP
jgi:hypothetical protein